MFGKSFNSFAVKNYLKQKIGTNQTVWKLVKLMQGNSFKWNYRKFYGTQIPDISSITEINIEFVNYCNLRCKLCSLDHDKPKVRMSPEILRSFLHDLTTDKRFRSVGILHLYNAGEVLLHPKLEEMLAILREFRDNSRKQGKHFPKVALLTNATVLDDKHIDILLNADILEHIRFSMDGGNREKFEEMRERAKWETFTKNVKHFCERNKASAKPIPTGIITLIEYDKQMNTDWMSADFRELLQTVDGYELRYAHNWGGEVEIEELKNKKPTKTGCSLLMHQLVLLTNGDITVCCADLNSKGVIGNITQQRLWDIYRTPKRLDMLQKMREHRKAEIELCKNCETF